MAIGPTLAVLYRSSGNPGVYRVLSGTTLSQVGSDLPGSPALESVNASYLRPMNRVVDFLGKLWCFHGRNIYEWSGSAWSANSNAATVLSTYMQSASGGGYHLGLYVMDVGGTTKMVGVFRETTSGQFNSIETADGSTWTRRDYGTSWGAGIAGPCLIYRNLIWTAHNNAPATVVSLDPATATPTSYSIGTSGTYACTLTFCVFEGRLFLLLIPNTAATTHWVLKEFKFGAFTTVHTFTSDGNGDGAASTQARYSTGALFPYNGKLYALVEGYDTVNGYTANMIELTKDGSGFTESDITSTVLPSELVDGGGNTGLNVGFFAVMDDETGTGAVETPKIYIWYQDGYAASSSRAYYEWNGPSSALTGGSSAPNTNYALSVGSWGAGDRIWSSGDLNVWMSQEPDTVATGTKIYFTASGDAGTGDKTVKIFYSTEENGEDMTQATLVASTITTESGSPAGTQANDTSQITNVDADPSVVYSVVWDTATDAIVAGQRVAIKLTIDP